MDVSRHQSAYLQCGRERLLLLDASYVYDVYATNATAEVPVISNVSQ